MGQVCPRCGSEISKASRPGLSVFECDTELLPGGTVLESAEYGRRLT
jgi:hypothetical protein